MNPSSFTVEYLSGLKFKELQKLSVQYHVNKRWAKKQELIDNLLALKNKEKTLDEKQDEEKEWRDGSLVFNDLNQNSNENEINRRLTFNISTKSNAGSRDPRLTFDVPENGKNLLGTNEIPSSRETYEVAPCKTDLDVDPRATFEIPKKEKLIAEEIDPRATFVVCQKENKLFKDENGTNKANEDVKKMTPEANTKGSLKKTGEKVKSEVKMLTIPCARVTRRTRKDGEALRNDNSPIKLSKKSINIKKSVRLPASKGDLIKSPMLSSLKKSASKQTILHSLKKAETGKVTQSKIPKRLQFNEEKIKTMVKAATVEEKENMKTILQRQKSRTADETLVKKSNAPKVTFMSPPVMLRNTKKGLPLNKTPLRKGIESKITPKRLNSSNSQTPGGKPQLTTKSVTVTKMPDFSKLHKKQFEQMDSLHDYLKKKEERARKLFGTPQPGTQLKELNKSVPIFQFQSSIPVKASQGAEAPGKLTTPFKKRDNGAKAAQKEAFKHRLPPSKLQTDIKDKNRSHIHGVRTNKRFELQMKFRNILVEDN